MRSIFDRRGGGLGADHEAAEGGGVPLGVGVGLSYGEQCALGVPPSHFPPRFPRAYPFGPPYRANASAVSSALVLAPTFLNRFDTWNLTVLALIPS